MQRIHKMPGKMFDLNLNIIGIIQQIIARFTTLRYVCANAELREIVIVMSDIFFSSKSS